MQAGPWATYSSFLTAVPSDTVPTTCRAIYIGGAGNVTVSASASGGTTQLFTAPPVGSILPIELNQGRLMATGTTATLMILLQ